MPPAPRRTERASRRGVETPASQGQQAALRLARRQFISGVRVEMQTLASELGVSRMTLNRWVGSRDRLLGEVNWSLAKPTLDLCRRQATGSGVEAVAQTLERFIATVLASPFMQTFLKQEGEIALRILTTRSSELQRNYIAYVSGLLREELPGPVGDLPIEDLAYLVVRITESFCYVDMITGDAPDATKVGAAIRLLLS
ncbi:AcrR family transcriptional regulator [Thermocatellispora tengchongensis]|uniref:AcrR family transcriptional regulator n=2 Tax=Thermocatellispora tengchongensis TaxID=1073253 RepID=A0A840P9G6_9ACTN|nr:QsdR family transcriptional regulator [Thermocatellispora tengchongensis]MBB5135649.1 AcrR family transcriptional regulator [Thermocatellispora tengchongensis]